MNAGKTITNSFDSLANTLKSQGEYNKQKNTAEAVAEFGAINDLNNLAAKRQEIVDRWRGKNADMAAISGAGDSRLKLLQGNEKFDDDRQLADLNIAKNQFAVDNQEDVFNMDKEQHNAELRSRRLQDNRTMQEYNANTEEALKAAETNKLINKMLDQAHDINKIKSKEDASKRGKGKKAGPNWELINQISNNALETTKTTQNKVADLYTTYPNVSKADMEDTINRNKLDGYLPGTGVLNGFDFDSAHERLKALNDKAQATILARRDKDKKRAELRSKLANREITPQVYIAALQKLNQ